ncbi:MAG: hypothetical protein E7457_06820 [Ruminococcaceae bacterium]|nr:hypothetical protein [Oscillospiraceae bacterium]
MEHTRTITGLILLCLLTAFAGFCLPNAAGIVLSLLSVACGVASVALCLWNVLRPWLGRPA